MTGLAYRAQRQRPALLDTVEGKWFIDGALTSAADSYSIESPARPGLQLRPADLDVESALRAARSAAAAQPAWAAISVLRRVEYVQRLAQAIKARHFELVEMIVLEAAKPLAHARAEVDFCLRVLETLCASAAEVAGSAKLDFMTGRRVVTVLRPVGPCLLITPWNFPVNLGVRKLATALIAGCTFVWKPAERTPLSAMLLAQMFAEIDLPSGVAAIIPTSHSSEVAAALMQSGLLRKLSFTGSTTVGKQLMSEASHQFMRTSFELGGNAPAVVGHHADLDRALGAVVRTKFVNSGQVCTTVNRLYVPQDKLDEVVKRLTVLLDSLRVDWPDEDTTDVGPLISTEAAGNLRAELAAAEQRGALVTWHGNLPPEGGNFLRPALVRGLTTGDPLAQRELFGPVINVLTYTDLDNAVEQANTTPYGLSAYAFSDDSTELDALSMRLRAGMIAVNSGAASSVSTPFGGVGWSGIGRENGTRGLSEFLDETTLVY